jgi:hypothetical protein
VISVTELLSVYNPWGTDAFWEKENNRNMYRMMVDFMQQAAADTASPQVKQQAASLEPNYRQARLGRLLHQLRRSEPDDRIGWSLFVYRLSESDLMRLTAPPEQK